MSQSGATVHSDCVEKFKELKLEKKLLAIVFKLSDDNKEIVVDKEFVVDKESSEGERYEALREHLLKQKCNGKPRPSYVVYDCEYSLASGEGTRSKITFIAYSPDDAGIQIKMVYASSKEALKRALTGIAAEIQANDEDDLEYDTIVKTISKGQAAS